MKEADMTISGVPLTTAQSLTVRLALQQYAGFLSGLPIEEKGTVEMSYLARIQEINDLISRTCR